MPKIPRKADLDDTTSGEQESPGVAQPETAKTEKSNAGEPAQHLPDPDAQENAHLLKGTAH